MENSAQIMDTIAILLKNPFYRPCTVVVHTSEQKTWAEGVLQRMAKFRKKSPDGIHFIVMPEAKPHTLRFVAGTILPR